MTSPEDAEACYYIIDARTIVGNCASLWCPDGQGYTCDVSKAGLYTKVEAERMHASRGTDIPVHRDALQPYLVTHLRRDSLSSGNPEFAEHMQAALESMNPTPAIDANDLSEFQLKEFLDVDPFEDRDFGDYSVVRDSIVKAGKAHECTQCRGGNANIRKGLRHRCRVEAEVDYAGKRFVFTNRWCHDCTRELLGYPPHR